MGNRKLFKSTQYENCIKFLKLNVFSIENFVTLSLGTGDNTTQFYNTISENRTWNRRINRWGTQALTKKNPRQACWKMLESRYFLSFFFKYISLLPWFSVIYGQTFFFHRVHVDNVAFQPLSLKDFSDLHLIALLSRLSRNERKTIISLQHCPFFKMSDVISLLSARRVHIKTIKFFSRLFGSGCTTDGVREDLNKNCLKTSTRLTRI